METSADCLREKILFFTELRPCDLPDFVTLAEVAHAHPVTICHHPNAGIQILDESRSPEQ